MLECSDLNDFSHPMFCWASLSSLTELMQLDSVVNNDARLVVGLLMLQRGTELFAGSQTSLGGSVARSFDSPIG